MTGNDTAIKFVVPPDGGGRADRVVATQFPGASRTRLAELFRGGKVRVDGNLAKKGTPVAAGATVTVLESPALTGDLAPLAEGVLAVLYQDDCLVAVDKPSGMPSHPLRAGETGTVANALAAMFPECRLAAERGDVREGGLVHRLDRGTSGVLVAARDPETWTRLRDMVSAGQMEKHYLALVPGRVAAGECDAAIAQRGRRVAVQDGLTAADALPAYTTWSVERELETATLLRCVAHTGRRHQIRAHLAHAAAPILGDDLYGTHPAARLFLHAVQVTLKHPLTSDALCIRAPLPASFNDVVGEPNAK